jgi:hypothetical protein
MNCFQRDSEKTVLDVGGPQQTEAEVFAQRVHDRMHPTEQLSPGELKHLGDLCAHYHFTRILSTNGMISA